MDARPVTPPAVPPPELSLRSAPHESANLATQLLAGYAASQVSFSGSACTAIMDATAEKKLGGRFPSGPTATARVHSGQSTATRLQTMAKITG